MIIYGTFFSSSEVVIIDPVLPGISFGAVSSKISCTTRNLKYSIESQFHGCRLYRISSPISITRSWVSSSVSYCHAQVCSASMNREGCCIFVDGMRISSKNPIEQIQISFICFSRRLPKVTVIPSLLDDRIFPTRISSIFGRKTT